MTVCARCKGFGAYYVLTGDRAVLRKCPCPQWWNCGTCGHSVLLYAVDSKQGCHRDNCLNTALPLRRGKAGGRAAAYDAMLEMISRGEAVRACLETDRM